MHVAVNGWFAGRSDAGSGQYIDHLLRYLAELPDTPRISLILPASRRDSIHAGNGVESAEFEDPRPGPFAPVETVCASPPRLPHNLSKLVWEQVTIPRVAARLRADVLWIPYWAAPFRSPCPVVVTVHDLIPQLLPEYRGNLLHRLYTHLVTATCRRAEQVIAVSQGGKRDVVSRLNISPERVHVVYHGPDQQDVAHPTGLEQVRERYALPARFFLYLGGFDRRKNVSGILRAYRRYLEMGGDPAIHMVVAGKLPNSDTSFAPDPHAEAARLGLHEQVHFCGWVSERDKPAMYALSTAYLFPSLYEGFGMMLLEAMAAGAPVITSRNLSPTE